MSRRVWGKPADTVTVMNVEQELTEAWTHVDESLSGMRHRYREKGDMPLCESGKSPPATKRDLKQLEKVFGSSI